MRKLLIIAAFLCSWITANAQNDFKKVDAWLADNAPAMGGRIILVVYKNGQLVYTHAENNMNMRQKMLNRYMARKQGETADLSDYTLNTRQPIASCSKWLSAALVMTFVDEGKLKLTDTVGKYLPILTQHGRGNITIKECLSHLTGIQEPPIKEEIPAMAKLTSMDDAIAALAAMPMEGQPGKVFHYSNAGLQIAGAVIEKIGGKSFQQLFAERIAGPLNMQNTDFSKGKVVLPAGGAVSTPQDYLNFLTMILNKGTYKGQRILSEKSVAQMQVNELTPDVKIAYAPENADGLGYGYGEWVMGPGVVSSPGLFGSFPWVDNNSGYAAFLMAYYLKGTGRIERYSELEKLVSEAVGK